ncbi:MAG: MBL fold hydrolase [Planctomycetota bacterium]|nr:MAG: MBL fold hydrolase [Planctomycetota bacterium]
MFLYQRYVPGLAAYSYLVGDERAGLCVVIDPVRDVEPYLEAAAREGLRLAHACETHVHADFVSGAAELKARLGAALTVHCSGLGGPSWTPPYADHLVADGDGFPLGQLRLQALHTPGHTPEHVSWAVYDTERSAEVPWLLLSGDFLFVGDVGRPDLLGEQAQRELAAQLHQSLFERIAGLPDFVEIYPAHGAGSLCGKALGARGQSTLGFERRFSPAFERLEPARWTAQLLAGMPPAPPYFQRMKRINAAGPRVFGGARPWRRAVPLAEARAHIERGGLVLDVRDKEAFAAAHIPGAISIPHGPNLAVWAGWVLPYDTPLLLVLHEPEQLDEVAVALWRIGFDEIIGYLEGGLAAWEEAGLPLARTETIGVHELAARLEEGGGAAPPLVLDVRTEAEWQAGHVRGALHIHAGLVPERLGELPRERALAVMCGSGYRASIAASLLERAGYHRLLVVLGGMAAWQGAGLPLVR